MQNWKNRIKTLLGAVPTGIIAVCIGISLMGYETPDFEVKAAKEVGIEEAKEVSTEEIALPDFDHMEINLPPTTSHANPVGTTEKTKKTKEVSGYKNGTYYGSGTGFAGTVRVRVIVKKHKIHKIDVTQSNDTPSYMNSAKSLLKQMIKKQSTNVDTVSGATYSSNGLIEAVRDALKDAGLNEKKKKSKSDKEEKEDKAEKKEKDEEKEITEPENIPQGNIPYIDGEYYGVGEGYRGDITVVVTIKDHAITSIVVSDYSDDDEFFGRAKGILNVILEKQSTAVDTVSGATFSSNGLIKAVQNALEAAKKATEEAENQHNDPTEELKDAAPDEKKDKQDKEASNPDNIPSGNIPYIDGEYYGVGEGYRGDITVVVTVRNHTLTSIVVSDYSDDDGFFRKAKVILDSILKTQSTDVDTVSGATFSSNGLIEAVQDALDAAKKATEKAENQHTDSTEKSDKKTEKSEKDEKATEDKTTEVELPQDDGEETAEQPVDEPKKKVYKDGVYTLAVLCSPDSDEDFEPYTLSATITIQNDMITSVTNIYQVDGEEDNTWYVDRAANGTKKIAGIVSQVTGSGNADQVDTVSGATCSSNAIISAIRSMLAGAKTE